MFTFTSELWLYPGEAAWYFLSVPPDMTDEIRAIFGSAARGWGSLPVEVTIGSSSWRTSIFPDTKSGTYLLPVKAQIRKAQKLEAGDMVSVQIEIRVD